MGRLCECGTLPGNGFYCVLWPGLAPVASSSGLIVVHSNWHWLHWIASTASHRMQPHLVRLTLKFLLSIALMHQTRSQTLTRAAPNSVGLDSLARASSTCVAHHQNQHRTYTRKGICRHGSCAAQKSLQTLQPVSPCCDCDYQGNAGEAAGRFPKLYMCDMPKYFNTRLFKNLPHDWLHSVTPCDFAHSACTHLSENRSCPPRHQPPHITCCWPSRSCACMRFSDLSTGKVQHAAVKCRHGRARRRQSPAAAYLSKAATWRCMTSTAAAPPAHNAQSRHGR